MSVKALLFLFFVAVVVTGCDTQSNEIASEVVLFPQPQELLLKGGTLRFGKDPTIYADPDFEQATRWFRHYLADGPGWKLTTTTEAEANIRIDKDTTLGAEAYRLNISEKGLQITARTNAGAFYALQTLRQLLPATFEMQHTVPRGAVTLPTLEVADAPAFSYRGMHLDVSRHFFPKEFIKEYLSYLALLKMNTFHWHLTDDQGWRIEIKKYPKLTAQGAFREETLVGHYNDVPRTYDGQRYGGFYTQEDIKEIVAYAQSLNIRVIPEIEMPGHAQAAISAYPEVGCTGEPVPVATEWGIFENVFCTKPETMQFLKDVLLEVMSLFPGTYIHIGGDEAPKTHWKSCADCQFRMLKEGIASEEALQSWFIEEIESFVNDHGKQIIGWDEILEGGLAPNATVMSWRGVEGGIAAAEAGHDVIMTPTSHMYFDYYQDSHPEEPLAIGGYLPLQKVLAFSPVPEGLSPEASHHILGAQGNVWTEYMPTSEQVTYMIFPRMIALSEVVWSGSKNDPEKAYSELLHRLPKFQQRLTIKGITHYNPLQRLDITFSSASDTLFAIVETPLSNATVRYEYAEEVQTYSAPVPLTTSGTFRAQMMEGEQAVGHAYSTHVKIHQGIASTLSVNTPPHPAYDEGGMNALNNGVLGSSERFGDGEWLGFWGEDIAITMEWNTPIAISKVGTRFFEAKGQWVYAPKQVLVEWTTAEGIKYSKTIEVTASDTDTSLRNLTWNGELPQQKIKKLVLRIPSYGTIPQGAQGAGNPAWTFLDELVIE